VAQEYAVVGDVDPRIGEHLLDVLAAGGIAAYLQPATDLHPVTRTTTLPSRPTDRLFADREHLATARDYLSQLTTTPPIPTPLDSPEATGDPSVEIPATAKVPLDEEAAWASIVAGYHLTVDPTTAPWPEAEDVETSNTGVADMETEPAPRTPIRRASDTIDQASLLDSLDAFGRVTPGEDDQAEDEDEGYTPPPPPPLPRLSAVTAAALIALAAGLLLFFWPTLLPLAATTTMFIAFAMVLGGFVTLIWRLRPGDEEDDDPDDGARV
jgi:hypothetical protein